MKPIHKWCERNLGGSISIGNRFVLYGWNAMHVAVNIRVFGGWLCLHPTWFMFGKWWPWYIYFSTDGTPCSPNCKWLLGSRH